MRGFRRVPWLLAGVLLFLVPLSGQARDKVVLQLKWRHQFQFAGYYAALERGYYAAAGLDVEIREAKPGIDPVDEVTEGRAQFGIGSSELVINFSQGRDIAVLAAICQHSPYVLIVAERSGIGTVHELRGKRIMIEPQAAEIRAYLKDEGVVSFVGMQHSHNTYDIVTGKADAMSGYLTTEPFELKRAGIAYRTFQPQHGGIDFYSDCLFVSGTLAAKRPELVQAFRDASMRGWIHAFEKSDELIDLIRKKYAPGRSREFLEFEHREMRRLVLPGLVEIGQMNPGRWRHIADTYAGLGMLPPGFSLAGFVYDQKEPRDLSFLYWWVGGSGFIVVFLVTIVIPIVRMNRKLRESRVQQDLLQAQLLQSQKLESIGTMASGIAHEINNPLMGMINFAQLIHDRLHDGDGEQRKVEMIRGFATEIIDEGQRIATIVHNLLAFSRRENETRTRVGLSAIIDSILALTRNLLEKDEIRLEQDVPPKLPDIMCQAQQIQQVLLNLITNARDALNERYQGFHVDKLLRIGAAVRQRDGRQWVCITIEDHGPGIPEPIRGRIFDPFFTTKDASKGTGLGLSISYGIVCDHGGEMDVESAPGAPTRFLVWLPTVD